MLVFAIFHLGLILLDSKLACIPVDKYIKKKSQLKSAVENMQCYAKTGNVIFRHELHV